MRQRQSRRHMKETSKRQSDRIANKVQYKITVLIDSMSKQVNCDYIQEKTSAELRILQTGRNIAATVNFIQDNVTELRSHPVIIHTGTNNVAHES